MNHNWIVKHWNKAAESLLAVVTYYEDSLSVSFKYSNQPAHEELPGKQLKTLNELYRYITEVTNDCLWEWDLFAKELFWIDGGHRRVFGYRVQI